MQVIDNEQVYMFDVDDTLVLWDDKFQVADHDRIPITDPYDGVTVYLKPHIRHIKLLKQMYGRGRHVFVWSAGGVKWAEAVVNALEISGYVHSVMTKPQGYVDDLPIKEWMQNRIYLEPDGGQEETTSEPEPTT